MSKIVWSISGLDTSGNAGIAADIKTLNYFNVHCCPLLTCIVPQNNNRVIKIKSVDIETFSSQFNALQKYFTPQVIKVGLIKSRAMMKKLRQFLDEFNRPVILDPILATSSGFIIHTPKELSCFKNEILPCATILTPNLPEAEVLLNTKLTSKKKIEWAAKALINLGVNSVIIKGGHSSTNTAADYWTDGDQACWLVTPKINTMPVRGTGCIFASALAANMANDETTLRSFKKTKTYLTNIITNSFHETGRFKVEDNFFPACTPIGFYPIVSEIQMLQRLVNLGVKTIQLRIKNHCNIENVIKKACDIAKMYQVKLFINDHWHLAIKYNAYGVHLGQEDLQQADLNTIRAHKLRLGISAHNIEEAHAAEQLNPSYIAIGPVFPSATKQKLMPLSVKQIKQLRTIITAPMVAIGGITLTNVDHVITMGADGYAVISALENADLERQISLWLNKNVK